MFWATFRLLVLNLSSVDLYVFIIDHFVISITFDLSESYPLRIVLIQKPEKVKHPNKRSLVGDISQVMASM